MTPAELIAAVNQLGGQLYLADEQLRLKAPRDGINSELKEEITRQKHSLIRFLQHARNAQTTSECPITTVARNRPIPVSYAQMRLWFLEEMDPGQTTFNMPIAIRLHGRVNIDALEYALACLVSRHESFRTHFEEVDGAPFQIIAPTAEIPLHRVHARKVGGADIEQWIHQHLATAFDLGRAPLIRAHILSDDHADKTFLLFVVHHIIADAWSSGIFMHELASAYDAFCRQQAPDLADIPVSYADFSAWQRSWLDEGELDRQLEYWKTTLADAPPILELPTDRPRPAMQSHRGAHLRSKLQIEQVERLGLIAQSCGASLFMLLHAAFSLLLGRHAGSDDVVVGTPVNGRRYTELSNIIGLFLNTLVIRVSLAGNPSFKGLLSQVRQRVLEAFDHQELPFEKLVEALHPERALSYSPIFQVMLNFRTTTSDEFRLYELQADFIQSERSTAKLDLSLAIDHTPDGAKLDFEFNTDLFDRETIARISRGFHALLEAIADNADWPVGDLPVLAESDLQMITAAEARCVPRARYLRFPAQAIELTLARRFEQQVELHRDRMAVESQSCSWTYGQLDEQATAVAGALGKVAGKGEQPRAGILMTQDAPALAAILGTLKAGWAYVPLDTTSPGARLGQIADDAGLSAIITDTAYAPKADQIAGVHALVYEQIAKDPVTGSISPIPCTADSLAYILFTSGSTGKPKGVMQTHRNVLHHCRAYTNSIHISHEDRLSLIPPYGFDAGVMDIFGALLNGACIVPYDLRAEETDPFTLERIRQDSITILHSTPTVFRYLLRSSQRESTDAVRAVVLGGEEARQADLDLFRHGFKPGVVFVNGLGPSESTVTLQYFASHDSKPMGMHLPVGRPVAETGVVLLDHSGAVSKITGELLIHSEFVTTGYWNAPDASQAAFIAIPGYSRPLYRTGDHARYLPDGNLIFIGRRDAQLKLRGHRIEAGEIEAVLLEHPAVSSAAVRLWESDTESAFLVAYVCSILDQASLEANLKDYLRERLPAHMVPARFLQLAVMPMTASGKIDRRSLPTPPASADDHEPPLTPAEVELAQLWTDVLGKSNPGRRDDFFASGGHSLLATQLLSRVRSIFDKAVPLRRFFEEPTIAALARQLLTARKTTQLNIAKADRAHSIPASYSQQRLWFVEQLSPGTSVYNLSSALRLTGALDISALQGAFNRILQRHEILRTGFSRLDDHPVQLISDMDELAIRHFDISLTDASGLGECIRQLVREPVNLQNPPLIRAHLGKINATDHVLVIVLHHIISDAWSMRLLLNELREIYTALATGRDAALPELPVQYADYAIWQRRALNEIESAQQLTYWSAELADCPQSLELPTDRPRPAVMTFNGAHVPWSVSAELLGKLKAAGRSGNATLFMVLFAAFNVLLARYSGQRDILVGTPIAGRTRPEVENLIGLFVNMLVLRTRLADNPPFTELLNRVRHTALSAYDNQDLPFERLVEIVQPGRDTSRSPLFQVAFIMQNAPVPWQPFESLELAGVPIEHNNSKFDITAAFWETGNGLSGVFEYNSDLFDRKSIERFGDRFTRLLDQVADRTSTGVLEWPILTGPETTQLLTTWNNTQTNYPHSSSIHRQFEFQVLNGPERIALQTADRQVTYNELNQKANRLAHYLLSFGVETGDKVAVCLDREPDTIVAILAILKAGAAYVPLDPAYPAERLQFMVEDCRSSLLLTKSSMSLAIDIPNCTRIDMDCYPQPSAALHTDNLPEKSGGQNLAYVIYTSGSTGLPKGTLIEHRSVLRLALNSTYAELDRNTNIGMLAPISFDASTFEMWGALLNGGRCSIFPDRVPSIAALTAFLQGHGVNTVFLTTALFNAVIDEKPELLRGLSQLLTGGEAVSIRHIERALEALPETEIVHVYGPTESTTFATAYTIPRPLRTIAQTIPIGGPIANTTVYVLDDYLQLVPAGIDGELYIGGDGISRGYLNQPDLTEAKFIANPFSTRDGGRLYKTGDIVRQLDDGGILFVGRKDKQLKLRGFRIEPGEIEACLREHPGIANAAVIAVDAKAGEKQLIGYFVAQDACSPDLAELREYLERKLPSYMVPAFLVMLDRIPLTPNGKLDIARLPAPGDDTSRSVVLPRNETERSLCALWSELLGVAEVGVHDNFFELGGHSLLIIKLLRQMEDRYGCSLTIADVFENATVAGLVSKLGGADASKDSGSLIPVNFNEGSRPCFLIHLEPELHEHDRTSLPTIFALDMRTSRGLLPRDITLEQLGEAYTQDICSVDPTGPYSIIGCGSGACIAAAIARKLLSEGRRVQSLILIDVELHSEFGRISRLANVAAWLYEASGRRPPRGLHKAWNKRQLARALRNGSAGKTDVAAAIETHAFGFEGAAITPEFSELMRSQSLTPTLLEGNFGINRVMELIRASELAGSNLPTSGEAASKVINV